MEFDGILILIIVNYNGICCPRFGEDRIEIHKGVNSVD